MKKISFFMFLFLFLFALVSCTDNKIDNQLVEEIKAYLDANQL